MLDEFAEEMAVFVMDNCSSHIRNDVIYLVIKERVRVTAFAPRITQFFQVFDLTFFDVLKRHPRYELSFGDEEVTVKFRMKVYHDFKQITVDFNICEAFQALTFEFDARTESY
jgi:hypothetical protein